MVATRAGGGGIGRRTRSQAAPEWTTKESVSLVNAIASVEGECLRALSSYQKWKMVVENCKSMEVGRTLNQCKVRWSRMVWDYDAIRKWEEESESGSYWGMQKKERKELGLPEEFDVDLFEVVDKYVIMQKEEADTDPQTDFLLHVITKLGTKRKRRRYTRYSYERQHIGSSKEMPLEINEDEEPQRHWENEEPQFMEEKPQVESKQVHLDINVESGSHNHYTQETSPVRFEEGKHPTLETNVEMRPHPNDIHLEERSQGGSITEKPKRGRKRKTISPEEEKERAIMEKLHTNAEMINAIVGGKLPAMTDLGVANAQDVEELRSKFVRCQGDALITCLGEIVSMLNQFPFLFRSSV